MIRRPGYGVVALAAMVALALAVPARAAGSDTGWQLRLDGVWVSPSVDYTRPSGDGRSVNAKSETDVGYGLAVEYRASRRIGWELGVIFAKPDIRLRGETGNGGEVTLTEGLRFTPITFGLNLHLTPDGPIDIYAGPVLAYCGYGNVTYDAVVGGVTERIALASKNDVGYGATLGADLALGDGAWSLGAAVTYIDTTWQLTELDSGEKDKVGFDPLIVTFGARVRF